jgi:hypothetical protein
MEISMPVARGISRQQKCTSTPKALDAYTARNSTPILRATRRRYCAQLDARNHNTTDTDTGTCVNNTGNYYT